MARIIAICLQKGGTGKTVSTVNLAAALAKHHKQRVLITDMDPQGNVSQALGLNLENIEKTVLDLLQDSRLPARNVLIHARNNIDVVPSNVMLSTAEVELVSKPYSERLLAKHISALEGDYDFILIDTPPNLGILTVNALASSREVVIPIDVSVFSIKALTPLAHLINQVAEGEERMFILHPIITGFRERQVHDRNIRDMVEDLMPDMMLPPIPHTTVVRQAIAQGKTLFELDTTNPATLAYARAAKELYNRGLERVGGLQDDQEIQG
jgi:chromosome partitioning protein